MNPYMLFSRIDHRSDQKREAKIVTTADPLDEFLSILTYKSINVLERLVRSTAQQFRVRRERGAPCSGTGAL